jgi:Xaa-Pro aminopeptidase
MHQQQRDRTHELLKANGIHRALFAYPANVTWLTGFARPWRAGADLYSGGPALVWYENGAFTLIVMNSQIGEAEAFAQQPNCDVVSYQGYSYTEQPAGPMLLAAALQSVTGKSKHSGSIGIEARHLPVALAENLGQIVAIDGWLDPLRRTRTAEELDKMRRNFDLIAVGQAAAKDVVQPGNLELDVWFAIHTAIQQAAQITLPLGNDCTVGRRMGGPAQAVEILPVDSFIVDLSTIIEGYWSDSCVTYYATKPSPKQTAMHRTAAAALDLAISLARPGAVAREIDQQVRQFVADAGFAAYPHHTGHGIGVDRPRSTAHRATQP